MPENVQEILQTVRKAVHEAVPGVEEVISYGIPAFKYHGWIVYLSAYKKHFSISCPPPFTIFEVFKKELESYTYSKSAIQFPLDKPIPLKLISDIAKFRAKENLEIEKTKKKK
jgi:uncharacterized protein YdhG (YjbR/CyaY superfamily)